MKYDVGVIGGGLGGLAAAAVLARRGKRVILLEKREEIGGALAVFQTQGFRFTTGTTLTFGFERGGALETLYSDLGIAQSISMLSPCYQVALPDRRINVYAEKKETQDELRREFPREMESIRKLYRDIRKSAVRTAKNRIYALFSNYRSAAGLLKKYRFSPDLTAFFNIQSLFFFHQPIDRIRISSLITLLDNAPFSIHGGMKAVADLLLDAFLRNGGEIRYGAAWPEIEVTHKGMSVLTTAEGPREAAAVLLNVPQEQKGQTLFVGVRDQVVPVGMSHELLCLPEYCEPNRVFSLSLSQRDDASAAPREMRALSVTFPFLPPQPVIHDLLLDQIARLIPFLKDHLIVVAEHKPDLRSYPFPPQLHFKTIRTDGDLPLLEKASSENIYRIHDGTGSLLQAAHAALKFADQLT